MSAKTAAGLTKNIYSPALNFRRRPGQGLKVATANVDSANDLDIKVEAALGASDSFEKHDYSVATTVYEATGVAPDALDVLELSAASAIHTNYKVSVRATASGSNGDYLVYAQTGEAIEAQ